jgi:3-deoxy-7-phosphoheptulonate synthase
LSCPVGFKNGTDGNINIATDAIKAASQPHHFLSVTKGGHSAIVSTKGNDDCHIILRGGKSAPNYDAASVKDACQQMEKAGLKQRLMIDANSLKKPERQIPVSADIASQISGGDGRIIGIMIESHLLPGSQELLPGIDLTYGKSITDGCIGWEESVQVLDLLAEAVRSRRAASGRTNFAP